MRSNEEIKKAILVLQRELEVRPQFNFFNEDVHEIITASLDVLENIWDHDDVYDQGWESELENSACSTVDYLHGEMDLEEIIFGEITDYDDILNDNANDNDNKVVVCKKLCSDCPFSKKSMAGFLADYTIEDFQKYMSNEASFPCHKMMSVGDKSVEETHEEIKNGKMKFCRGYVESVIKSAKMPRSNDLLIKAMEIVKEDGLSEDSMDIFEFRKFHTL